MREARPITTPPRLACGTDGGLSGGPGAGSSPAFVRSLAQLRSAITHHVSVRRVEGVQLGQVLAEVGDLVGRAEFLEGSPDELGVLLEQVRRWSLDAYLDEPELRNAPRFY